MKRLLPSLAAVAVVLGLAQAAEAQTRSPRETVQAVGQRIRDLYFDPAAANRIADALEAEAAAGAYDDLTDGRDLAAALSTRLRPQDAHFVVQFDPARVGEVAPAGPPQRRPPGPRPAGAVNPLALANHGFRRVEVLPGNIGLIELRQFSDIDFDDPDDGARRAAEAALSFVDQADAVIFDLRDNGGGAPSMVGYLSSAFTPADADIYNVFHNREGTTREAPAAFHPRPRLETPVYILTSGRTGSAGEAFPYTLQAAGRATIVGQATGGAANPGGMVPAGDGFAVFVSMGSPRNPITGRNWEGTGVIPDIEAPSADALAVAYGHALEAIAADEGRPDAAWALAALRADVALDLTPYAGAYGEQTVAVEDGRLRITRGRRPPVVLAPLQPDLFYVVGDPLRRVRFERAPGGGVIAMESLSLGAPASRARRTD